MMRPFRNGKGSYDLIAAEVQEVGGQQRPEAILCAWYVYASQSGFRRGCTAFGRSRASSRFLWSRWLQPDTEDYALQEEDLPQIFEEYDRLAAEMVKREKEGRGFNFFHFMIDLTGGPCVYKAPFRLRIGNRIPGGNTVGRSLPVPSVRRTGKVPDGKCGRGYCPKGHRG